MGQSPIDFFANVKSRYNELHADSVRCKLLLPHKYAGPIRIKFYPSKDQQTAFRVNGAELHSLISEFLVLISFAGRQRWDVRQGLIHKSYYRTIGEISSFPLLKEGAPGMTE